MKKYDVILIGIILIIIVSCSIVGFVTVAYMNKFSKEHPSPVALINDKTKTCIDYETWKNQPQNKKDGAEIPIFDELCYGQK